jgi:hypothetical protein
MGKEMITRQIPATFQGVNEVNQQLMNLGLKKGGRGNIVGDVPGFGVLQSITPAFLLSEEGKNLKGAVIAVTNKMLQAQSGLAVTDKEQKRFAEQIQQGTFRTDKDFLEGWKRAVAEFEQNMGTFQGQFHPDVRAEYTKRNPKFDFTVKNKNFFGAPTEAASQEANPAAQFFK